MQALVVIPEKSRPSLFPLEYLTVSSAVRSFTMSVHSLPEMSKPPVAEVVCGVFFAPLGGLDGLSLGAYWAERRVDFPERRLLTAVFDSAEPMIEWGMGTPPLRSWVISGSEEYIVQLQQDRFYLNWRAGKSQRYPRFQNTPNGRGIASLLTEEFARFGAFCDSTLQERPTLLLADLSKINTLTQGVHWNSFDDLKAVLPIFERHGRRDRRADSRGERAVD